MADEAPRSCLEYDCVDCGFHVYWVALPPDHPPPVPARCATCQWIAEHVDPADYARVRAVMNGEG